MSTRIDYFSFNSRRADERWKNFADDLAKARNGESFNTELGDTSFYNLTDTEEIRSEDSVIRNLKFLDLDYGSVSCRPSEYDDVVSDIEEALAVAADLRFLNGILQKEDLIRIYSIINKTFFEKAVGILTKKMGWTDKESREILLEFFHNMHPVVKDLKENNDSILVFSVDVSDEVEPGSAEELLMKRARDHLQNFRDIIV